MSELALPSDQDDYPAPLPSASVGEEVGDSGGVQSRRQFLGLSWKIAGVLAIGQGAYMGLRFLSSRQAVATTGQIVIAGMVTDFEPGTVTPFDAARFFLVRFADGGFLALHSKCTHLACIVGWNKQTDQFACPCHGSIFDQEGSVLHSPAPRPLDRYPIVIGGDGRLQVDTTVLIARGVASLGERVYP